MNYSLQTSQIMCLNEIKVTMQNHKSHQHANHSKYTLIEIYGIQRTMSLYERSIIHMFTNIYLFVMIWIPNSIVKNTCNQKGGFYDFPSNNNTQQLFWCMCNTNIDSHECLPMVSEQIIDWHLSLVIWAILTPILPSLIL